MSTKGATAVTGKRVPDLVLVMDSDPTTAPEFRVQCEVVLDHTEAKEIYNDLYGSGPGLGDVTKVHKKIKNKLGAHHSAQFHAMVDAAFRGNGSTE